MYERVFSKSGLSLDRLRVLVELERAGSLAKAAGEDPVRQSQYSRQLKELESCFGVSLTRRQGKNLALTAEGRRLARIVHESLTALNDFIVESAAQPMRLTIGAGDSLIHWLVIPSLAEMQSAFPKFDLAVENLRSAEILERLRVRSLDFGILRQPAKAPDIRQALLGTLSYQLFVPKKLLPGKGPAPAAQVLRKIPVALPNATTEMGRASRSALFSECADARVILEADSFPELLSSLQAGTHAVVLPNIASSAAESADAVAMDIPSLRGSRRKIALCWSARLEEMRPGTEKIRLWMAQALTFP